MKRINLLKAAVVIAVSMLSIVSTAMAAPTRPNDLADQTNASWLIATEQLLSALPRSVVERAGGSALLMSFQPQARMNGVFGISRQPDLDQMSKFAAQAQTYGVSSVIRVRGHGDPEVQSLAARYGMTQASQRAVSAVTQGAVKLPGTTVPGAVVKRVDGSYAQTFLDVTLAATGVPVEFARDLVSREVLNLPTASPYVVEVDGKAVAIALGIRGGDMVALYFLFERPEARGIGYNMMVTEQLLRDSFSHGVKGAFFASDPENDVLISTFGFRAVDTWTTYSKAAGL